MSSKNIVRASFANQNIADINSGHALVMPEMDPIIHDIVSRDTIMRSRIQTKPEGIETFRWVEYDQMARNAAFSDPRNINPTETNQPVRKEHSAKLKCITSRITYGLYDSILTRNGTFPQVLEDDMRNALADCLGVSNSAIINGNDTSYEVPTTPSYMGLMTAVTQTATFNTVDLIYQQIRAQVAHMANKKFGTKKAFPTIIYMNPETLDLVENEVDNKQNNIKVYDVEVVAGTKVPGIMTAAGILPIVADPEIPLNANATDPSKKDHKILLLNENYIVRHYLTDGQVSYGDPVVFELGRTANLATDYVIFMSDNVVAEYGDVAHCIATLTI